VACYSLDKTLLQARVRLQARLRGPGMVCHGSRFLDPRTLRSRLRAGRTSDWWPALSSRVTMPRGAGRGRTQELARRWRRRDPSVARQAAGNDPFR